ncbi:DUF4268 domain-containing protein [Sandaracinobacter sp. RS1-74]|uniref:DUF4268 domain-containing protein n=1 Tax=Sandaracinobacteroides sayramensis TaxID=2913411 RepID=UPI001EDBCF8E|nr:DUF4268 domain-containing protein [Sandaracinobacteroides sayramensis]MCG2839666.1 DUF4268 domain-containing protein [Sandaracinobacteroides sayramensis]
MSISELALGRLERVELRSIWANEAGGFTPWLAREDNLATLADTLGLELELEAQEQSVGPFRADLLCKDIATDSWVLIENQLERTDHTHLGQLLTYASGLSAVTIVWIAARFTEEHRSTLDWLNRITDEHFRFFGLEVELWRISSSPAAPKFNIVSKPNDWSRAVAQAARSIDDGALSELHLMQRDYWAGLHTALEQLGGPLRGRRTPQPQSWMAYRIGRTGFSISAVIQTQKKHLRAELYLTGNRAKAHFHALEAHKAEIEQSFGRPLQWHELPDGKESKINLVLEETDPTNRADWPRQHAWLAEQLNALHRLFAHRVRQLSVAP